MRRQGTRYRRDRRTTGTRDRNDGDAGPKRRRDVTEMTSDATETTENVAEMTGERARNDGET